MTTNSLIDKLRRRIKDDRPIKKAMNVAVSNDSVQSAIAEVVDGHFVVQVSGGSSPSIDLSLSDPRYATVGRLAQALSRMNGYTVSMDEDAEHQHMSLDIAPVAPVDIGPGRSSIELRHHLFSESELDEVIEQAIQRHNPSFTEATLPDTEHAFVLLLAHAEICRRQAYDVAKRAGLDTPATDLLALARNLEDTYLSDVERLSRALISPQEATPNTMGPGDIVVGTSFRSSLRSGRRSPFAAQSGPVAPILIEPDAMDVEDEIVTVRWVRNADNDFHSYELWMDTVPDISATPGHRPVVYGRPTFYHYEEARAGTSNRVMQVAGASIRGQGVRSFQVRELEPEVTYYFKLFVTDGEGGVAGSGVMSIQTKALRTRFNPTIYASTLYGPPGTEVILFFDSNKGPLTENHRFRIGEYEAALMVDSPYQARFIVPSFTHKRAAKPLTIESPSGLRDIAPQGFMVT